MPRRHLTYANVTATLALIVAIAGGSTAIAVSAGQSSKKSDVNNKGNIRAQRVTTKKLAGGAVTAPKLGQIELISVTALDFATAECPSGTRLLSGGGEPQGGAGVALEVSRPVGNGWQAAINSGVGARNITVYALCLR